MILEIADIRIPPGKQAEFDAAIQRGVETVVSKAKGFRRYQVQKGIESPERYVLLIEWETLENHTVDFRGGPLFPQWRAIVGPYFASPPVVEHFTLGASSARGRIGRPKAAARGDAQGRGDAAASNLGQYMPPDPNPAPGATVRPGIRISIFQVTPWPPDALLPFLPLTRPARSCARRKPSTSRRDPPASLASSR
jgi:heme-degrading monooxygenase HmoA